MPKYDARRMMAWISAALMRNVEDLEIVYNYEGVVVPRCFFYCTSLTSLKLQLPCIFRPIQNWFSNLKVLYLVQVEILNEHGPDTNQLMFNFPVLESCKLDKCRWLKVTFVEIHTPSLTKFYVEKHSDLPEVDSLQIQISRAELGKFEFYGNFLEKFDLSASSVLCASIDFCGYAHDLQGIRKNGLNACLLLKECSGLNHLQLSGAMVEWLWNDYDYDLVEPIPSCIVSQLNEVEFHGFKGERPHVHMADFFLKNAVGLKKMFGLARKKCEERRAEKNFWPRLKGVYGNGDFELGSWKKIVANMADFERLYGP